MPHTPEHTVSNTAQYKIYGTDEPYNGMTVEIGGFLYSTVGGALEGDSMQLVSLAGGPHVDTNQMPNVDVTVQNTSTPGNTQNNYSSITRFVQLAVQLALENNYQRFCFLILPFQNTNLVLISNQKH